MAFFFFLLLNAVLFIRPEELFPVLMGLQLYQALILVCLATAVPSVLRRRTARSLASQAITLWVVGLVAAGILSEGAGCCFEAALGGAREFGKVVPYYLLSVGIVDTLP